MTGSSLQSNHARFGRPQAQAFRAISMHKRPSSATRQGMRFHTRDTNRVVSIPAVKQAVSLFMASNAFVALIVSLKLGLDFVENI
jgi:hypothetical protein